MGSIGRLIALLTVLLQPAYANITAAPLERVSGTLETTRGFTWKYSFDVALQKDRIQVRVAVNLVRSGVTKVELERVTPSWKSAIERKWSNRFALVTAEGERYPILVAAQFRGPDFNHDVIVRPDKGHTDELNWHLRNNPALISHEFGHMLGAFDEYPMGALDPVQPIIDDASVMSSALNDGQTYARHYREILQWYTAKTGDQSARLEAIEKTAR